MKIRVKKNYPIFGGILWSILFGLSYIPNQFALYEVQDDVIDILALRHLVAAIILIIF